MVRVGVLVLMHDKQATMTDWQDALGDTVTLQFFHPVSHPLACANPHIHPLSLAAATHLDAFIITGAPIDRLDFTAVRYYPEVSRLIQALTAAGVPTLYSCWGALAALHTLYGIDKKVLPQKLFGVFAHQQLADTPLLQGLPARFQAPHARYTDVDATTLAAHTTLFATTTAGTPMLAGSPDGRQTFLFAHLEYRRWGLWQEHEREGHGPLPLNDAPQSAWPWAQTRTRFFANWRTLITNPLATIAQ